MSDINGLARFWHRARLKARRLRSGAEPRRYRHLAETVRGTRARRLLEIGTWDGAHAAAIIAAACSNWPAAEVEYFGVDLFEWLDEERFQREISKRPPARVVVEERLAATGAKIRLFQGDTVVILPDLVPELPQMDFVFIDGGHSYETVKSDWTAVEKLMHARTVVLFDDYWNTPDAGTNRVVSEIDRAKFDVEILDPEDEFLKEWGVLKIRFVRVRRRASPAPAR